MHLARAMMREPRQFVWRGPCGGAILLERHGLINAYRFERMPVAVHVAEGLRTTDEAFETRGRYATEP